MYEEESESGITGIAAPVFDRDRSDLRRGRARCAHLELGRAQSRVVEIVRAAGADASHVLQGLRV